MPRFNLSKITRTLRNADGTATAEEQSKAARRLGARTARKYGRAYMRKLAAKGAAAYWDRMTPDERVLELRRRAITRRRNRKAKIAAAIAAYRGTTR